MRMLILGSFALVLAAAPVVEAQESEEQIMFVGQLLSVTLTRKDYSEPVVPDEQGRIVVSNSCGTLDATFRVVRSTAPLPDRFAARLTLGEWCIPSIEFEAAFWLAILDARSKRLLRAYWLFDDGARVYAFDDDSPNVAHILVSEPLNEPVDDPFLVRGDRQAFVEGRRYLMLGGDDWIQITHGAPVDAIFPGFTVDEFFEDVPR